LPGGALVTAKFWKKNKNVSERVGDARAPARENLRARFINGKMQI